ncbi:MAG TPA: hypothetical protein VD794_07050, partial [Flavisolibacter sp.]|nr:hypothetical protein [Flavisolibacter sp.]
SAAANIYTYLSPYGVAFDDIAQAQVLGGDTYTHGLIVDVDIKCDITQLFCREYMADPAVSIAMRYGLRFKTWELILEQIRKSSDVNRYTTMSKENLLNNIRIMRNSYQDRINYLTVAMKVTSSNCFSCKEQPNVPSVQTIFI